MGEGSFFAKLNRCTDGELENVLLSFSICPVCVEKSRVSKLHSKIGEQVCLECGFAAPRMSFSQHIPFNETMSPESLITSGRGLGETLGDKGAFCVLAHTAAFDDNKQHLPMHAQYVKIMTHTIEPPRMQTLLKLGRARMAELGVDSNSPKGVMLRTHYANLLRVVGRHVVLLHVRVNLRKMADACLALSYKQLEGENKFLEICCRFDIKLDPLKDVMTICEAQKQ